MVSEFVCTITPNPALDLSGIVENLIPNEKSYVHDEARWPGGNAINVARILTRLEIPVLATGFLGGGIGQEIKNLLDDEGVRNHFIKCADQSRVNVTISNNSNHKQTRLSFPGPQIRGTEKNQLVQFFRKRTKISLLVIGGSLPKGFSPADIGHLMKIANQRKIKTIVDCPGRILPEVLKHNPYFIKPNLEEFQELVGKKIKSIGSVQEQAKKILDKVPLICVSSVEGGALLITRQGSFFGRIPAIKIKSTVGAGDSMVGAMAAQLFGKNESGEELLRWGLAAAAATLSQSGTTLGSAGQIRKFYQKTSVVSTEGS